MTTQPKSYAKREATPTETLYLHSQSAYGSVFDSMRVDREEVAISLGVYDSNPGVAHLGLRLSCFSASAFLNADELRMLASALLMAAEDLEPSGTAEFADSEWPKAEEQVAV